MRRSLFALAAAASLAAAPPADWSKLIDQLGEDTHERAAARLTELGDEALPALRRAALKHHDADVRLRAVILRDELQRKASVEARRFGETRGPFHRLAVAPDGRLLSSSHQDWYGYVWDARRGVLLLRLEDEAGHAKDVYSVAFSSNGRRALTGDQSGVVRLWNPSTGKVIKKYGVGTKQVQRVAFSDDGKRAVCACDEGDWLRVVDLATGKVVAADREGKHAYALAVVPGAEAAAIAGKGGDVWLVDLKTGARLRQMKGGMKEMVASLSVSPDGKLLAGCGGYYEDRPVVRLWDVATGEQVRDLRGHEYQAHQAAFSPDGERLVSCGDESALVWDVASGRVSQTLRHGKTVTAAAWLPGGGEVVTSGLDDTMRLWRVRK